MIREWNLKSGSVGSVGSGRLLPAVRTLYSRLPETYHLKLQDLQHILFSLGYTDYLADEAEAAAAVEVADPMMVL